MLTFSFVLPTYNRVGKISAAIDSLLDQSCRDFELVIVDDGSTDGTSELIKERYAAELSSGKIRYIENAHRGVCAARNAALEMAKGPWIAYLDSDNRIDRDFIASYREAITAHPEAKVFYSKMHFIEKNFDYGKPFDRDALLIRSFIDLGTFVHHRSVYERLGGFDEKMTRFVDWDLILRYTKEFAPVFIDKAMLFYDDAKDESRISVSERLDGNLLILAHKHWPDSGRAGRVLSYYDEELKKSEKKLKKSKRAIRKLTARLREIESSRSYRLGCFLTFYGRKIMLGRSLYKYLRYGVKKVCAGEFKDLARCVVMLRSGLFKTKWYVERYPEVKASSLPPVAHYLHEGWQKFYDPSEGFSTKNYIENTAVNKLRDACPLVYYIRHDNRNYAKGAFCKMSLGEQFAAWHIKLGRFIFKRLIGKNSAARIFVHLHVFYPDMWPAVRRYLETLGAYRFDLVVTYPAEFVGETTLNQIRADYPNCRLRAMKNSGFDVGPFMEVLSELDLDRYDIVYHVHTKSFSRGPKGRLAYGKYFMGAEWFNQLYDGCMGPYSVHRVINALLNDGSVSMVAAKNLIFKDVPHRTACVRRYAKMMGLGVPSDYSFIGGFCFAAKASELKKVAALGVRIDDFGTSQRFLFTFAHALERLIPILLTENGKRIKPIRTHVRRHWFVKTLHAFLSTRKYRRASGILKREGIRGVKRFGIDTRSGLKLLFLEGTLNGKRVFVKYGAHPEITDNEGKMQAKIHALLPENVPAVYLYDGKKRFIAMDCVEGYNLDMLLQTGFTADEKRRILDDLELIRLKILSSGYQHRDIMPANFIWDGEHLKLIDFQFMVERDAQTGKIKELKYVSKRPAVQAGLGNIYRKPGADWDDDYSFGEVVEFVNKIRVVSLHHD